MPAYVAAVIAVIVALVGVVQLFQGQILFAIVLFIAAALIGPGGYSIFKDR
ncbi:MAG: GPGG-motif small membrane protein [Acidimicrobiia bacterium]